MNELSAYKQQLECEQCRIFPCANEPIFIAELAIAALKARGIFDPTEESHIERGYN